MKNQKKVRESIKQIKREISNALYFISQIQLREKDKKSAQAHVASRMTLKRLEDIVSTDLSDLEKDIVSQETEARTESLRKALGTINSPSLAMQKTADNFIEGSKQPNVLMKKAMQEQIKKASLNNAKKTGAGI